MFQPLCIAYKTSCLSSNIVIAKTMKRPKRLDVVYVGYIFGGMRGASQVNGYEGNDLRTVPLTAHAFYTEKRGFLKVWERGLYLCGKTRSYQGLFEFNKKYWGNHALFKHNKEKCHIYYVV